MPSRNCAQTNVDAFTLLIWIQLQRIFPMTVIWVWVSKGPLKIDIRDLIGIDDAVEELKLGPNGGLVFCIEYLSQNTEWLLEELSQFDEDGYFIFDCPGIRLVIWIWFLGQIELFTHFSYLGDITKELTNFGFHLVSLYLVYEFSYWLSFS